MKKLLTYLVVLTSIFMLTACAGMQSTASKSPVLDRIALNGELVVGTAASMPPLNMTTKDGKIIGLDIDLAQAMADSMGVKLRLEPMQFNELLPALEVGKIDMILSGMTITYEGGVCRSLFQIGQGDPHKAPNHGRGPDTRGHQRSPEINRYPARFHQ